MLQLPRNLVGFTKMLEAYPNPLISWSHKLNILALQDDGSGHQEWTISQVTGGYTITMQTGRAGCATFLSSATCANGNGVGFIPTNDGSGLGVWAFAAVQPATPGGAQLFPNGIYTIGSQGRAACGMNLNAVTCANGNGVYVDAPAGTMLMIGSEIKYCNRSCC